MWLFDSTVWSENLPIFFVSLLITVVISYLLRFYLFVSQFPRGPFPLPLIGNLHYFFFDRLLNKNANDSYLEMGKKFGSVYTFWMFNLPVVIITDPELVKISFNQKRNSYRNQELLLELFTRGQGAGIIFQDFGSAWLCLRKVAHNAVRKFATNDRLPKFVYDTVTLAVEEIKLKEGVDKAFDISKYVSMTVINILASSTFGKSYHFEDEEIVDIAKNFKMLNSQIDFVGIAQMLPRFFRPFVLSLFAKKSCNSINYLTNLCHLKMNEHLSDYQAGDIRDFADSLIAAKNEAIQEGKKSTIYLTDHNLSNVIFDFFFAGIDTTWHTLTWCFLLMTKYPEIQTKLRQEVKGVIGNRVPVQEDRHNCHYLMAFISEVLRLRPPVPFGAAHSTKEKTKIGCFMIPEKTFIMAHFLSIGNDSQFWFNADQFDPNRFLNENGRFKADEQPIEFMPFSVGRRVCLGEKLAWADIFLVLANFIIATDGLVFQFDGKAEDAGLELDPRLVFNCQPKPFKIKLVNA